MQNENTQEKIKSNPIDLLSIAVSCSIICDSETHLNTVSRCAPQEYFRSLVEGILQSAGTPHYLIHKFEKIKKQKKQNYL